MRWIRRLLFGRGAELGVDGLGGFAGAGRAQVGSLVADKGPFDEAPAEEIDLDPDALPWELRDDEPRAS